METDSDHRWERIMEGVTNCPVFVLGGMCAVNRHAVINRCLDCGCLRLVITDFQEAIYFPVQRESMHIPPECVQVDKR